MLVITTFGSIDASGARGFETFKLAGGGANSLALTDSNFTRLRGQLITVLVGGDGHVENRGWWPHDRPHAYRDQLKPGRDMPRGVAWRRLPPALQASLPAHRGHGWYAVGPDVVLVALATGLIESMLSGAFD